MSKKKLVKRLKSYYPLERFHAFFTFPFVSLILILDNSFRNILFLLYGLLVCIFILCQGQHYWKLKLYRLTSKEFVQIKNLSFFKKAKILNIYLILLMPFCIGLTILPERLADKIKKSYGMGNTGQSFCNTGTCELLQQTIND